MTVVHLPNNDPLSGPLQAFSAHATDCLALSLNLALLKSQRSDLAWHLDSRCADLELSIHALRPVLDSLKWKELAA